eukprot:9533448-Alexandrium_andersonii.AAC.1
MGAGRRTEDDSIVPFMTWAGLVLELEDGFIVHENVDRFDVRTLVKVLGSKYDFRPELNEITSFSPAVLGM